MLPISGSEMIALIPQRPPFVMIDKLLKADATSATTSFVIRADNVLCDNGKLNTSGLIENMAQTAAAMAGYRSKLINEVRPTGFIGQISNFDCARLPAVGDELITEINEEKEVFGVAIILGKVLLNNEVIASCKMKIFRMAETNSYIKN